MSFVGKRTCFRIFCKTIPVVFEERLHSKSTWISSQERPSEVGEISPQDNPLTALPWKLDMQRDRNRVAENARLEQEKIAAAAITAMHFCL